MQRRGVIFFDAQCGMCSASVRRWERFLTTRGFEVKPMQTPEAEQQLGLSPGQLPGEMKLLTPAGTIIGGVDVFAYVTRFIWWAYPLHLLLVIAPTRALADGLYRWIAPRRRWISQALGLEVGVCQR